MLPLLKLAADNREHHVRDAIDALAKQFGLSEQERKELLPSGLARLFDNRIGWARTYLKKAGLIEYPKRGYFKATQRGQELLSQNIPRIDVAFLKQYPEFLEFWTAKKPTSFEAVESGDADTSNVTPEEALAIGYSTLRKQIESDLLARVKQCAPDFFEGLVVKLLTTMGYGGSLADAGRAIGKTGDGGVDGVIKEDKLGLELLYIQAKRWNDTVVGSPEIQKFVGALHGKKAKKGIFMTTSTFSKSAVEYAAGLDTKVILIDGAQLAELMFDYEVGVSTISSYSVKRIDSDFFSDEDEPLGLPEKAGLKSAAH
jgi:restriction system protein